MNKIIQAKRKSTPKLSWADKIKFEFGSRFRGQKGQKNYNRFWPLLAKLLVTVAPKCTQLVATLLSTNVIS